MAFSVLDAASAHGLGVITTAFLPVLSPLLLPSTKDFLLTYGVAILALRGTVTAILLARGPASGVFALANRPWLCFAQSMALETTHDSPWFSFPANS